MRKRILGSIAALAAGAGGAWGQSPMPIGSAGTLPPGLARVGGDVIPIDGQLAPVIMPPIAVGPPGDPQGLGPVGSYGPPPGPMYPPPGPYTAPMFQPPPNGGGAGGGGAGAYGTAPRFWMSGDYLLWFAKGQPVDFPLLTTSSPNQGGLLNNPSTIQLVPTNDINYSSISGFRLTGGFMGDADRRFGAEVSGFYTERKLISQYFSTVLPGSSSVGIPLLARPYVDTTTGSTSLVIANLGLSVGSAAISTSTSNWSVEANAVWNLFRSEPTTKMWNSIDFLAGYRFMQIKEDFTIQSMSTLNSVNITPIFAPGPFGVPVQIGTRVTPIPVDVNGTTTTAPATVQIVDRFKATNNFNGGTFALRHECRYGMFSLQSTFKLGVGNMHQVLEIQGSTTFVNPVTGQSGGAYGGLYANSTNIGRYNNDEFAVIPELTMNFGLNLTQSLSLFVGYNFLYVNNVARPGNQLNPYIDASTVPYSATYGATGQVPGSQVLFVQDEFWLSGVNFGMSFKY